MECCAARALSIKSNLFSDSSSIGSRFEIKTSRIRIHNVFTFSKSLGLFSNPPLIIQGNGHRLSSRTPPLLTTIKAESRSIGTPLEPHTPEGKFLCGMLKNHPHIFSFAASVQLKELALIRNNALARYERSIDSPESCLHERIAKMKEHECQIAIEEVIYLLIVHNFYEIKVPMIPNLSNCTTNGKLEIWSSKIPELESIYEPEMLEMVREHISNILKLTTVRIKRLQLGRIYAASIMYGYFLKSVQLRHRLELSLPSMNLVALKCLNNDDTLDLYDELRGYMMRFDSKTLQICAKLRSREASNLIEKHTWALFGGDGEEEDGEVVIGVTGKGLRRLVMEAVAFGSFLWEVERYVDSMYRLTDN